MDPELHKSVVVEARKRGKSPNSWVSDALSKAIEGHGTQQGLHADRKTNGGFTAGNA
jgi:hypothetical protein